MEADRHSDELLLNALVDGELSPTDHAAAAARLANDREFAHAYATLTRLKAGVAGLTEDRAGADIKIAAPVSRRRYAAAAGVSAALAASIAAFALAAVLMPSPESDKAVAPAAGVLAVAFAVDPVIPDLSPAGLQLARTVLSAATGGQALVATYIGPRGCRLELWVSNASMSARASGGTERRRWHVNGLVYELIAFGMPAARFEKVANAAEKATRATVLPHEADRQLIEARVSTTPCLA